MKEDIPVIFINTKMALFNFLRKKNHNTDGNDGNPVGIHKELLSPGDPAGYNTSLISGNGTRGLDAIYAFLQYDYESRGYNDALTNPDESYKADNIMLFHHDLIILIDKSSTYYEDLLKEVDFHINSRTRAGLIDLVEELKIRREMVLDHIEKVKVIRKEAVSGTGSTQRIALSYQRGFMRGLSAISQSKLFNGNL